MTAALLYLWVGLMLAWHDVNAKRLHTWRGIAYYVAGWLPIEAGDYLGNKAAVLTKFYLRVQAHCEDAILRALYAEIATTSETLYDCVLHELQGQEPGWFVYHYALRSLRRRGLIHKQTRLIADHLHEYRNETWYNLSKAGIREVRERGLQ